MAEVTFTAAQIAPVDPMKATIRTYLAAETITKGQPVYIVAASGRIAVADSNEDAAHEQFRGVALNGGGAGQEINVLEDGLCYGFTLSGSAESFVYLSNDLGKYADAAGDVTVPVGRVVCLPDKDNTKVLRVFVQWEANWA